MDKHCYKTWSLSYVFDQLKLCGQYNGVASHGAETQDYRKKTLGLPGSGWTGQGMTVTKDTPILTTLSGT